MLIVEDHEDIRELMLAVLEHGGIEPFGARDAREARSLLPVADPDVLVTDYDMPTETGVELLRSLRRRARWRTLPAILTSANADRERLAEMARTCGAEFLPKPYGGDELVAAVRRALLRALRRPRGRRS